MVMPHLYPIPTPPPQAVTSAKNLHSFSNGTKQISLLFLHIVHFYLQTLPLWSKGVPPYCEGEGLGKEEMIG